jgi:hypothetical protein
VRALALAALTLVACAAAPAPTSRPSAPVGVVVATTVPNGRVEVVVQAAYPPGAEVRSTVRLIPSSGTLRGPLDPYVEASGFTGTAIVRHLAPSPVTASAGSAAEAQLSWDATDDAGRTVPPDDYTLVLGVIDDQGRRTLVAATIVIGAR